MAKKSATASSLFSSSDDDPRDLTSEYVQECLGFHESREQQSRKLDALLRIRRSLQSCCDIGIAIVDDALDAATDRDASATRDDGGEDPRRKTMRRKKWRMFLAGRSPSAGEDDDDDDDDGFGFDDAAESDGLGGGDSSENNFMLRDSLIKCLVEHCGRPPPPGGGDDDIDDIERDDDAGDGVVDRRNDENGSIDSDVTESAFVCLTHLVRLRCNDHDDDDIVRGAKKMSKPPPSSSPAFGHEFVASVAPAVVEALESADVGSAIVSRAACGLLVALLRPDRPRNETCLDAVRDEVLHPVCTGGASESQASIASVACVARVLSSSIITAVEMSVPDTGAFDEEELSMRRETAALNRLQDMREVMMGVGLTCSRALSAGEDEAGTERILSALQEVYDVAAFAVESQLETLLGDVRAMPILIRLSRARSSRGVADNITGVPAPAAAGGGGNAGGAMDDSYDDDASEDGKEAKLEEACTLAPLYANIPKPPAFLTTYKNLESMLVSIEEKLNTTESSLWDERLGALVDLECILAGGVARMSAEARDLFVEKLRRMPLGEQFQDLRSQITQQVCRVVVAASYEYRDHVANDPQLNQALSHMVECLVFPSILNLCKSGTRLMAAQGMNCLLSLSAVCGGVGYPRTVPRYCEEILGDGKVHKNRKRGSVMALTVALRVWKDPAENGNGSIFVKHLDQLVKATKEAATNRDPAVREEGRKLYWAMVACCNETGRAVQTMFHESSREMKNLKKERDGIDSEWEEGAGAMSALVKTGVLGPKAPPKEGTKKQTSSRLPRPGGRFKRPAAGARFRAEHGTPFKSQRVSTPMKLASKGGEPSISVAAASPADENAPAKLGTPSTHKHGGKASFAAKFSGKKSVNHRAVEDAGSSFSKISRARLPTNPATAEQTKSEDFIASASKDREISLRIGKENSSSSSATAVPLMKTPTKKSTVAFPNAESSPGVRTGTPLVNLLARASPISAEKLKNTGDVLGTILSMLNDTHSPHEQSLGIKALALFAKEEPKHRSWDEKFPLVLGCLLDQIKNMPTAVFAEPVDFIRSPTKKSLSSCHQMQHLFLQGVRSLLQFVSSYVKSEHVKDIVCCMLECTKDAPFEIVHTAERALHNLVTGTDPETCFEYLLPFAFVEIDLNDKTNPPAFLSTMRTVRYLVDRISVDSLKEALPSLLPLFQTALCHKSVDMRKATVFVLVEMHFVLGEDGPELMDDFTDCQRRLVGVYIDRHAKNKSLPNNVKQVPQVA